MFRAGIDGVFLLLIVSMILSIASSAAKKRKNNGQKEKKMPEFDNVLMQNDSELDSEKKEFGHTLEELWPEIKALKNRPNPEYKQAEPTVIPQEEGQVLIHTTMNHDKARQYGKGTNKYSGNKRAKSIEREEGQEDNTATADAKNHKPNELMADFDLRKAIIYSEIMSPKYKEY